MSLSSSLSSSNLQAIKASYLECLSDISEILALMDEVVESLELATSSDVDSSLKSLQEFHGKLEDYLESLNDMVNLPPDYEDPPPEQDDLLSLEDFSEDTQVDEDHLL